MQEEEKNAVGCPYKVENDQAAILLNLSIIALLKVCMETITQCLCWNFGDYSQAYLENTGFQDKEVKGLELS